jgi:hypothetical protein
MRYRNTSGTWRLVALLIVICICSSTTLLLRLQSEQTAEHSAAAQRSPVLALEETGFHSIFDGKTLTGWDGDPNFGA